jgi:hypothetical protein
MGGHNGVMGLGWLYNTGLLQYRVFAISGYCYSSLGFLHIMLLHIGLLQYRGFVHACSCFCSSGYRYRVIDIGF